MTLKFISSDPYVDLQTLLGLSSPLETCSVEDYYLQRALLRKGWHPKDTTTEHDLQIALLLSSCYSAATSSGILISKNYQGYVVVVLMLKSSRGQLTEFQSPILLRVDLQGVLLIKGWHLKDTTTENDMQRVQVLSTCYPDSPTSADFQLLLGLSSHSSGGARPPLV